MLVKVLWSAYKTINIKSFEKITKIKLNDIQTKSQVISIHEKIILKMKNNCDWCLQPHLQLTYEETK